MKLHWAVIIFLIFWCSGVGFSLITSFVGKKTSIDFFIPIYVVICLSFNNVWF